jgi:hypothetical protein
MGFGFFLGLQRCPCDPDPSNGPGFINVRLTSREDKA